MAYRRPSTFRIDAASRYSKADHWECWTFRPDSVSTRHGRLEEFDAHQYDHSTHVRQRTAIGKLDDTRPERMQEAQFGQSLDLDRLGSESQACQSQRRPSRLVRGDPSFGGAHDLVGVPRCLAMLGYIPLGTLGLYQDLIAGTGSKSQGSSSWRIEGIRSWR